jgi:hypothetical protein
MEMRFPRIRAIRLRGCCISTGGNCSSERRSCVNPNVDHPRWSQAKERRLGEFLKRPTLMFNGYDQVASLYSGMNLKKDF